MNSVKESQRSNDLMAGVRTGKAADKKTHDELFQDVENEVQECWESDGLYS